MSFLTKYLWKLPQPEPMDSKHFLKCEFMTKDEKVAKSIAMDNLKGTKLKLQEGEVAMYNHDNQYKVIRRVIQVSYRETFEFETSKSIQIARLLEMFQSNENKQYSSVYEFYNENVETIELVLYGGHAVKFDELVHLMDLEDKLSNDSSKIVEFIYTRKGFINRMKQKAKKVVISLPGMLLQLIKRIISTMISWMGLNSITSLSMTLFKSFVGYKQIMQYLLSIVTLFFPMLAPLLGIAKLIG